MKSQCHTGMKLAPVRVFTCKHPLTLRNHAVFSQDNQSCDTIFCIHQQTKNSITDSLFFWMLGTSVTILFFLPSDLSIFNADRIEISLEVTQLFDNESLDKGLISRR